LPRTEASSSIARVTERLLVVVEMAPGLSTP
jgi:hypothetical protein